MNKIYNIVFCNEKNKQELYYKTNKFIEIVNNKVLLKEKNTCLDLFTYFNSFSIKKWKKYTTIKELNIKIFFKGKVRIIIEAKSRRLCREISNDIAIGEFEKNINIENINEDILGIKIISLMDNCIIKDIIYSGIFDEWQEQKIGVVICTYKREKYVSQTIEKLVAFCENNKYLSILVVDNGNTLKVCEKENLKIIYNPNYGGSGGFTRGIIENIKNDKNTYVLLMDDDIQMDTSVLEKTYSLLCGLKMKYKDSFLSGAMLNMDIPYMQYESTAYWNKIKLYSCGKNYDLRKEEFLLKNEEHGKFINQYAAWWYCVIPLKRVKEIGLPLPMFIKGDDMEYSIRNNKELMYMNGIGVWHEPFNKKISHLVNYFSDRNMLIINNFAGNCNRLTLIISILARCIKRLIKNNKSFLSMLDLALIDYIKGFDFLVTIKEENVFERLENYKQNRSQINISYNIFKNSVYCLFNYSSIKNKYINFRNKELKNIIFWEDYLKIRR